MHTVTVGRGHDSRCRSEDDGTGICRQGQPLQLDDVKLPPTTGYTASLTWTAPTAGEHGTSLDASKLALYS